MSETIQTGKKQVTINETDKVISKETFEQLQAICRENMEMRQTISLYKMYFELVFYCVIRFTSTFGLNNAADDMIDEDILSGEKSPIGGIMKKLTVLMKDGMLAETNPEKARQFKEKFAFLRYIPTIAQFFNAHKSVKAVYKPEQLEHLPTPVKNSLLNAK